MITKTQRKTFLIKLSLSFNDKGFIFICPDLLLLTKSAEGKMRFPSFRGLARG